MEELLLPSSSESHSISTEVEIVGVSWVGRVVGIFNVDPAFFIVPSVAYWIFVFNCIQLQFVALCSLLRVVHDTCHHFSVHDLFAACVDFFSNQKYIVHAAVFVTAADLHVVQHGVTLSFDLDVVDQLEKDATVFLRLRVWDLEFSLHFVLICRVWKFVSAQDIENLALQNVLVREFHLLSSINVNLFVAECDSAFSHFVSSAINVYWECCLVIVLWQVLSWINEVKRAVECVQDGFLNVVCLVKTLRTDEWGSKVIRSVFLLSSELAAVEADDYTVLQLVFPIFFDSFEEISDFLVL